MVKSGAVSGVPSAKGFFYMWKPQAGSSSDSPRDPLEELIGARFVEPVSDRDHSFQVHARGLSGLVLMQTAIFGGSVAEYQRVTSETALVDMKDSDALTFLASLTRWELQMILMEQGWQDVYSTKRKMNPIVAAPGTNMPDKPQRVYYYDHSLGRDYLTCLIMLERMFSNGLLELHHFQLQNYYSALMDTLQSNPAVLSRIVPNQPTAFYKELKTRNQTKHRHGTKRKLNHATPDLPEGFESEISLSGPRQLAGEAGQASDMSTARRSRARGKGRGRGRGAKHKSRSKPSVEDGVESNAVAEANTAKTEVHHGGDSDDNDDFVFVDSPSDAGAQGPAGSVPVVHAHLQMLVLFLTTINFINSLVQMLGLWMWIWVFPHPPHLESKTQCRMNMRTDD